MTDFSNVEELDELPDATCTVIAWIDKDRQLTMDKDEVYGVVFMDNVTGRQFIINSELLAANEETGHAKRIAPN